MVKVRTTLPLQTGRRRRRARRLRAAGVGEAKAQAANEEVKNAGLEMVDLRNKTEADTKAQLGKGGSTKRAGNWTHEHIHTTELAAAAAEMSAFPRVSEAGKALGTLAALAVTLRTTLLTCSWEDPAGAGLAALIAKEDTAALKTLCPTAGTSGSKPRLNSMRCEWRSRALSPPRSPRTSRRARRRAEPDGRRRLQRRAAQTL